MDLLISLGVNSTLVIQFATFLVLYAVLKYALFAPYFAAYNERSHRTVGKAELAERYIAETKQMEEQFAAKAQEVNEQFKAIYDKTRSQAMKDYDRLVGEARTRSKALADEAVRKIHKEMDFARAQLGQEVSSVAQLINQKLIGKEITK